MYVVRFEVENVMGQVEEVGIRRLQCNSEPFWPLEASLNYFLIFYNFSAIEKENFFPRF